jgi:signal transduction histidine kinase
MVMAFLGQLEESNRTAESSSEFMIIMIQDFLDYAQLKQNKFRVNITRFNIREVVQRVLRIQMATAQAKKIRLHAEFTNISEEDRNHEENEELFSPMVTSDAGRIMQVMLGLQSNALKFTKRGEVRIKVGIEKMGDDKIIKVAVQDTGVGIPASDLKKLFRLFGFIDNKNSAMNTKGIGLGLVIAKGICRKFGGTIRVRSVAEPEEGHGSTFEFFFKFSDQSRV